MDIILFSCLSSFPVVMIKYANESKKEKGFALAPSSRAQTTIVGKAAWQEFEAAGQITSTVRKWRVGSHAIAQFHFPFL